MGELESDGEGEDGSPRGVDVSAFGGLLDEYLAKHPATEQGHMGKAVRGVLYCVFLSSSTLFVKEKKLPCNATFLAEPSRPVVLSHHCTCSTST